MVDVDVNKVKNIDPVRISELRNIDPLTIAKIQKIAPAAVHIKELNNIDPLSIESLRIDRVHNLDPLQVERFNVTSIPTVNLSLSRLPAVDLNVKRVPPVAIALQQNLDLSSNYTVHTRFFGFEILRMELHGCTKVVPKDRHRREQSKSDDRSYTDVAPAGNPGIPVRISESCTVSQVAAPRPPAPHRDGARRSEHGPPPHLAAAQRRFAGGPMPVMHAGAPRFQFPAQGAPGPGVNNPFDATGGTVSSGD
jgi:hypothetical protein